MAATGSFIVMAAGSCSTPSGTRWPRRRGAVPAEQVVVARRPRAARAGPSGGRRIVSKLPIAADVLTQHVAVLGKTGSGKTSTAKLAIEQVVAEDARVCVLDPIKSD